MSLNEFECMLCWDVALGCFKQRLFLFNVGGGAPSRRQLSTHNDEFDGSRWMRQNANLSPSRYSVCKMNIDINFSKCSLHTHKETSADSEPGMLGKVWAHQWIPVQILFKFHVNNIFSSSKNGGAIKSFEQLELHLHSPGQAWPLLVGYNPHKTCQG